MSPVRRWSRPSLAFALVALALAACGGGTSPEPADAIRGGQPTSILRARVSAAEGGSFADAEGRITVRVPPGALNADASLNVLLELASPWRACPHRGRCPAASAGSSPARPARDEGRHESLERPDGPGRHVSQTSHETRDVRTFHVGGLGFRGDRLRLPGAGGGDAEQRVGGRAERQREADEGVRARKHAPPFEPAADLDCDVGALGELGLRPAAGSTRCPELARERRSKGLRHSEGSRCAGKPVL